MKRPLEDDGDTLAAQRQALSPSTSMMSMAAAGMDGQLGDAGLSMYLGGSSAMMPIDPEKQKVATTPMDFTNIGKNNPPALVPLPKNLVEYVMTAETKRLLEEQSGAAIEWSQEPGSKKPPHAMISGSPEQARIASKLLSRVKTHCTWGCNADKVHRLLKPRIIEKALCRLSPMDSLSNVEKVMSPGTRLSIGKGRENDGVVNDPMISRTHCFLELSADKGAIYIADCSTNGTYLNGVKLPSRKQGKVLVSHGDELLLKEPSRGHAEFGYIVNISEIHVKAEVKLDAPRRILSAVEVSMPRDFP